MQVLILICSILLRQQLDTFRAVNMSTKRCRHFYLMSWANPSDGQENTPLRIERGLFVLQSGVSGQVIRHSPHLHFLGFDAPPHVVIFAAPAEVLVAPAVHFLHLPAGHQAGAAVERFIRDSGKLWKAGKPGSLSFPCRSTMCVCGCVYLCIYVTYCMLLDCQLPPFTLRM